MNKPFNFTSHSQIEQFRACPVAYKYAYIDGVQVSDNIFGKYACYGTAIHKALEFNFFQKITSKKDLSSEAVTSFFEKAFLEELNKDGISLDSVEQETFVQSGILSLDSYMTKVAPAIQPRLTEQRFEVKFKHYPITVVAKIDLITEDDIIIDFKSVGRLWKKDYTPAKVMSTGQFSLYAAIFRKMFKRKEKQLEYHILPRGTSETPVLVTDRTEEQVKQILELATAIELTLKNGVLIPNHNSCSTCAFNKMCPKLPYFEHNY